MVPDPKLLSKKCSFRRGASARRVGAIARSEAREIIFRTREKSLFSSSCSRVAKRNRSSAVELLYKVSLPQWEHENPSEKTRLKVGQRPKFCWARRCRRKGKTSAIVLHTAASCSLSVTSSINGRRLAAVRAAFSVVVTTCSSLQVRVQLGKRAIAAVLVLGVRGVVYTHRLVLGFQPHRCGLKDSKICVRNQRFKGSIGSKSPLRAAEKS